MSLFHLANEGIIRVLSLYFEMEQRFAGRALDIYKTFAKQTEKMNDMFSVARKLKSTLAIDVPNFKHVSAFCLNQFQASSIVGWFS